MLTHKLKTYIFTEEDKLKWARALVEYTRHFDDLSEEQMKMDPLTLLKEIDVYDVASTITDALGVDLGDAGLSVEMLQRYVPHWKSMMEQSWKRGNDGTGHYFDYVMAMNLLTNLGLLESGTTIRCSWTREPYENRPFHPFGDMTVETTEDTNNFINFIIFVYEEVIAPKFEALEQEQPYPEELKVLGKLNSWTLETVESVLETLEKNPDLTESALHMAGTALTQAKLEVGIVADRVPPCAQQSHREYLLWIATRCKEHYNSKGMYVPS